MCTRVFPKEITYIDSWVLERISIFERQQVRKVSMPPSTSACMCVCVHVCVRVYGVCVCECVCVCM